MLNFRKRIKNLSEKTSSVEAKDLCKEVMENFVNVPEAQMSSALLEKFKSLKDADKAVKKFVQETEKIDRVSNLGVSNCIAKLKESQIYTYPALRYAIEKTEQLLISQQMPEYMVIEQLTNSLKPLIWDTVVESIYRELMKTREDLNEEIVFINPSWV